MNIIPKAAKVYYLDVYVGDGDWKHPVVTDIPNAGGKYGYADTAAVVADIANSYGVPTSSVVVTSVETVN